MKRYNLVTLTALFAVLGCLIWAGSASAAASVSYAKQITYKKHRKHKPKPKTTPATVSLKPAHTTVRGEFVSICDTGWPTFCHAPSELATVAYCPDGYYPIAGGWEAYGSPQNLTITMNNINGGGWTVGMRANSTKLTDTPHVSTFRAIVICETLIPA